MNRSGITHRRRFPKIPAVIKAYEAGLDCYQRRDWQGGLSRFSEALDLAPNDRPSRIFLNRCRYYQINRPDEAWDGVWIMQEKWARQIGSYEKSSPTRHLREMGSDF